MSYPFQQRTPYIIRAFCLATLEPSQAIRRGEDLSESAEMETGRAEHVDLSRFDIGIHSVPEAVGFASRDVVERQNEGLETSSRARKSE